MTALWHTYIGVPAGQPHKPRTCSWCRYFLAPGWQAFWEWTGRKARTRRRLGRACRRGKPLKQQNSYEWIEMVSIAWRLVSCTSIHNWTIFKSLQCTHYSHSCRQFLYFIFKYKLENLGQQEIHQSREAPGTQQEGLEENHKVNNRQVHKYFFFPQGKNCFNTYSKLPSPKPPFKDSEVVDEQAAAEGILDI